MRETEIMTAIDVLRFAKYRSHKVKFWQKCVNAVGYLFIVAWYSGIIYGIAWLMKHFG